MANGPHTRLTDSQNTLRTQLNALAATTPDDPRCAGLADDVDATVRELLEARRDIDALRLQRPNRVIGAVAVAVAVAALIGWFSAWNVVPVLLGLVVGSAVVIAPTGELPWEPRARTVAGSAAVLGALLTPLLGGWSAVVVLAGIGWWAWRCWR